MDDLLISFLFAVSAVQWKLCLDSHPSMALPNNNNYNNNDNDSDNDDDEKNNSSSDNNGNNDNYQ